MRPFRSLSVKCDKARTRIAAVIDVLGKAWEGDVQIADALRQIVIIVQDAKDAEKEFSETGRACRAQAARSSKAQEVSCAEDEGE